MFGKTSTLAIAGLLACVLTLGPMTASSAEPKRNAFKVVGTWGNLSNYMVHEQPFWSELVTERSGGAITAHVLPLTELGLKGFEVMRLLKLGVFDFAHGVIGYVATEDAVFEGVDLAGIAQSIKSARKVTKVYRPILRKAFKKTFKAKLMMMYPFPSQLIWCNTKIDGIEDLKGKRIRTYSTTLGDFIEGAGATSVTVAFAQVVPALKKGIADCGITGTMPAYRANWDEAITHVLDLRVGWGISFGAFSLKRWNTLDEATQKFLTKEFAALEKRMWAKTKEEDEMGINCNTGLGVCTEGETGKMKLVRATSSDERKRKRILNKFVLRRWAQRCGESCVKDWNATVGKYLGLTARPQ